MCNGPAEVLNPNLGVFATSLVFDPLYPLSVTHTNDTSDKDESEVRVGTRQAVDSASDICRNNRVPGDKKRVSLLVHDRTFIIIVC